MPRLQQRVRMRSSEFSVAREHARLESLGVCVPELAVDLISPLNVAVSLCMIAAQGLMCQLVKLRFVEAQAFPRQGINGRTQFS